MKITFVLPTPGMSGGIRVAAIYAQLLQQRGHEVFVVAAPPRSPTLREQVRSLRQGKGWIRRPKRQPSHLDDLGVPYHLIDRARPIGDRDVPDADVVISTWWETTEWVNALSPARGRKVYFIQHYEMFDYLPKDRVAATYHLPLQKITIAQWIADVIATEYGDRAVTVVPNAIDPKQFYAPSRDKQAVPTVGVMYSTATWKGCDISLKAVELAQQQIPNLKLLAFAHETVSPNLPLPKNAEFFHRPSPSKLREIYAQCDGWLFGSRYEGFGLPILEAMACRTPVIGTPSGAAPDLLQDGTGYLLQSHDPEEMAAAIAHLCNLSSEAWRSLSDRAYQKATCYTWEDATDLFEAALNNQSSGFSGSLN